MARPRIVIVGAGFGGLSAAAGLAGVDADVTVIDRHNYHLFQPLLYQVATAGLSPAQIAAPIRAILRKAANVRVILGEVSGIDRERRSVLLDDRAVDYDVLVLAAGARHAYFGHDDWERVAPGLKNIDDATGIRRRILSAFEHAEQTTDAEERRRLLTFVVIGGGPTGVEMAGAIAELAHVALRHDFRTINPREARRWSKRGRALPSFPAPCPARSAAPPPGCGRVMRPGAAASRGRRPPTFGPFPSACALRNGAGPRASPPRRRRRGWALNRTEWGA
jgi:NADH dehydrogenase FAD-containing subunit